MKKLPRIISIILLLLNPMLSKAQPLPGDIFRQYIWTTGDFHQEFLRVTGDGDYREPVHHEKTFPESEFSDGWLIFPESLDLEHAIGAEIMVEKVLSHDGTRGLAVKRNDSPWITFPESEHIPSPQWDDLHHTFPVVEIPLHYLNEGKNNRLRFKVDSLQRFGMPQNILYGIHVFIYYDKKKEHSTGKVVLPGATALEEFQSIELQPGQGKIKKVDFIGFYEDLDYNGDGLYKDWQRSWMRGELQNHMGSAEMAPWTIKWDTRWIPDQNSPVKIAAVIHSPNGISSISEAIEAEGFNRNYQVILCKAFNQPKLWATREGEFTMAFDLNRNPKEAVSFQMAWNSWSPGYLNGVYLNDWLVFAREGENYTPHFQRITFDKPYMLNWGTNMIKTGKTPRINGNMVHGTEIQYPGFMVLVKFPLSN